MTYMITNIIGIVNQQIPDQTPSKAGRPSCLNPVMINLPWRIQGMLMPVLTENSIRAGTKGEIR